jgi:lipid II:glycine glycyltransferase (peptidoglycan interpeptide bridge formation enzyme)
MPEDARSEALPYVVDIVTNVDGTWDRLVAGFSDLCLEQTAAYTVGRWGNSRLCGLVLRGAMSGEPEAAALALVAAVPLLKAGLAYVKFGPLWKPRNRPERPHILKAALTAIRQEFTEKRGLLTRVMPPAEPEDAPIWAQYLQQTGFSQRHAMAHPDRYLVDLSLSEDDQMKSLGAKWRANLRKASPLVSTRECDPRADLPDFLALYGAMTERKQFADNHHVEHLPAFVSAAPPELNVRLFMAYADGRPVAGSLLVGSGESVFVPFSASSAAALPLRAGYALRWAIINRLRGTQTRWLDLGGHDGDDGLRHFKTGNVGRFGQVVTLPGEFDAPGSTMSNAAGQVLRWAHGMSRQRVAIKLPGRGSS